MKEPAKTKATRFIRIGADAAKDERAEWLAKRFLDVAPGNHPPPPAVIYVSDSVKHIDWTAKQSIPWNRVKASYRPAFVFMIWDAQPIDVAAMVDWLDYLSSCQDLDFANLICPKEIGSLDDFTAWFETQEAQWIPDVTEAEAAYIRLGDHVRLPENCDQNFLSAAYLSLSYGGTQKMLEQLGYWRRKYLNQIAGITPETRKEFHKRLKPELHKSSAEREWSNQEESEEAIRTYQESIGLFEIYPAAIPTILIRGESGSGKTMIARQLARGIAAGELPLQIVSMPEYEKSENQFEHDMFGYRGGEYTDSPDEGSPGHLLNTIGGIVFLDEIGDASLTVQRKLLRYLDDYQVRPKGLHHSIFCPVLIIAATNLPLEELMDSKVFRRELYERFDAHVEIPSLNIRKEKGDFPLILDEILQNPGLNQDREISEIGKHAYDALFGLDYKEGNFRRLERIMQAGFREAKRAGRLMLTHGDIRSFFKKEDQNKGSCLETPDPACPHPT